MSNVDDLIILIKTSLDVWGFFFFESASKGIRNSRLVYRCLGETAWATHPETFVYRWRRLVVQL